ncbi:hypothetical protein EDB81DRAFT_795933 [Dactylonectria macrodidyma]|uniref:Uncharacterized protein n=1 Tax=Dactylonectria macrodidyma TaxID=307937 RepID=A0A9P9ES48_9HYPO|nr:hypothetical protein EDB81DRAFT_795933 [Dactylonectria macrodidyma]
MAGSPAWSSPLPSLLPVAIPATTEDDTESPDRTAPTPASPPIPPTIQYGFGAPLNKHKEASYFMHFIRNLASWFDTCDPACHFGIEVPKRAHHLPLLAYSILAFSARQLSLTTGVDDGSHSSYYSHALRILIPIFDNPSEAMNENVLAGIVILRSYEEMFEGDVNTHLIGSSRLLNSESHFTARGGLGEAACWVVLRQDLYVCLTRSLPLRIGLDAFRHSSSFIDTSDHALANRAVFICCRVVLYALAPDTPLDPDLWDELDRDMKSWYASTPWRFLSHTSDASAINNENDTAFPILWMPRRVQALGYQHYYIARMMLDMFHPKLWKPSFEAFRHRALSQDRVRESLRILLGLTVSNSGDATVNFTAHHSLHAFGGFLRDTQEHNEVLRFLQYMTRTMGWPTQGLADKLREQWGQGKRGRGNEAISPDAIGFREEQVSPQSGVWGSGG